MNSTGNFGIVRTSLPLLHHVLCPTTEDVVTVDEDGIFRLHTKGSKDDWYRWM